MKTELTFDQDDIVKFMKLWIKVFDKGEYISHKFYWSMGRAHLEVEVDK
jgi:hypothetical protein